MTIISLSRWAAVERMAENNDIAMQGIDYGLGIVTPAPNDPEFGADCRFAARE
jgi:hypothetical protein